MVVPVVDRTRSNHQTYTRPAGILSVQTHPDAGGKQTFLPIGFVTADRTGSLTYVDNRPRIRLREQKGELILTSEGFYRGEGAALTRLRRYTDASLQSIGLAFHKDRTLQGAMMALASGLFGVTFEYIAATGIAPDTAMTKQFRAAQEARRGFAKRPAAYKCEVTTVTTTVTDAVLGWVQHIETAAAQLAACSERCMARPAQAIVGCLVDCAGHAFSDIAMQTWEVIGTVNHAVVTHVTHCLLTPGFFPSYTGLVPVQGAATIAPAAGNPADAAPALLPFEKLIGCILKGAWSVGDLSDIGATIPGVRRVPVTLSVCMGRSCADEVKIQSGTLGFQTLAENLPILLASGAAQAWLAQNTVLAPLLPALAATFATTLGFTVAEVVAGVVAVVLAALLALSVQALLIAGQILALDFFNQAANGICLNYPAFPVALVGMINPVVGLVLAANTPVIVTGR